MRLRNFFFKVLQPIQQRSESEEERKKSVCVRERDSKEKGRSEREFHIKNMENPSSKGVFR